jgi:hypothetical protein
MEVKKMSDQEARINRFANFVEAGNFFGAKEALKEAYSESEEIMMKAILMKASEKHSLNPGMYEFINNVVGM